MGRVAYASPRTPDARCEASPCVLFVPTLSRARRRLVFSVDMADDTNIGGGWRLLLLVAGFGIAMLGWTLIMTALFAFIGLPVFIFGLALMQAQEP